MNAYFCCEVWASVYRITIEVWFYFGAHFRCRQETAIRSVQGDPSTGERYRGNILQGSVHADPTSVKTDTKQLSMNSLKCVIWVMRLWKR